MKNIRKRYGIQVFLIVFVCKLVLFQLSCSKLECSWAAWEGSFFQHFCVYGWGFSRCLYVCRMCGKVVASCADQSCRNAFRCVFLQVILVLFVQKSSIVQQYSWARVQSFQSVCWACGSFFFYSLDWNISGPFGPFQACSRL